MSRTTIRNLRGRGARGTGRGNIDGTTLSVVNAQRRLPVNRTQMTRLLGRALQHLRIRPPGAFTITFIDADQMRQLNKQFCHHDRVTDVLSFRYDGEPIIGEIVIAPAAARAYANAHGLRYEDELSRYVIHGLLHWIGHDDRTPAQQRTMRALEDRLLAQCDGGGRGRETGGEGKRLLSRAPRPAPRAP